MPRRDAASMPQVRAASLRRGPRSAGRREGPWGAGEQRDAQKVVLSVGWPGCAWDDEPAKDDGGDANRAR